MKTFKTLLGSDIKMGMYSGSDREMSADYMFSTVQTISKEDHLLKFEPSHFDYIVIDETHRAGAYSYKRIMDYFTPKFMLGMTATPERTDGADVFKMFDYNIAYEIRLHRALEEDMLCPFHYYGITDLTINGEEIDDQTEFNKLFANERVDRIIENAERFGCDDGEVRGLVFCSRNEVAHELSRQFNERGYQTIPLTGANSEAERQSAIRRLESEQKPEKLDYIFTVDIFNEGIDIPRLNQIIMLRPTQSAIIFVQQLGRGLRKTDAKEYLTVIDFIGNYSNNYLVPIALYGDKTYNRDTLRKLMSSGSSLIPGSSTINFDEISKNKIFEAINSANMSKLVDLKNDYYNLKNKLGRIPMMIDFLEFGSRDPRLYIKYKKSYINFINTIEDDYRGDLSSQELKLMELFNLEINNVKRVEESIILLALIEEGEITSAQLRKTILQSFDYLVTDETIESCIKNLNFNFVRQDFKILKKESGAFKIDVDLNSALRNKTFKKFLLDDVLSAIKTFKREFDRSNYINGFIRYKKYGRKDVSRILNWEKNLEGVIFGYKIQDNACPLFVTLKKAEDIPSTTKYEDKFLTPSVFQWMTRSRKSLKSDDVIAIRDEGSGISLPLFIQKKSKDKDNDFYFIGFVSVLQDKVEETTIQDKNGAALPIVKFNFEIDKPVEDGLFDYLIN